MTTKVKAAVCTVSASRSEHLSTITWLNESDSASFFRLNLKAIKIGSTNLAPLLSLIVAPSAATKDRRGLSSGPGAVHFVQPGVELVQEQNAVLL